MRSALVTTFVVGIAAAAYAQAPSPSSNPTTPTTPTTSTTVPMVTAPAATGAHMSTAPAGAHMSTAPAGAHMATTPAGAVSKEAVGEPQPGANSFTEAQARARLDRDGFANVTGLAKDQDGIWRGKAMKGTKSVEVAVDYQGKIVAR